MWALWVGFRKVWGFGVSVWGLRSWGLRAECLGFSFGFRVQGLGSLGFRVQGFWFRAWGSGFLVLVIWWFAWG